MTDFKPIGETPENYARMVTSVDWTRGTPSELSEMRKMRDDLTVVIKRAELMPRLYAFVESLNDPRARELLESGKKLQKFGPHF